MQVHASVHVIDMRHPLPLVLPESKLLPAKKSPSFWDLFLLTCPNNQPTWWVRVVPFFKYSPPPPPPPCTTLVFRVLYYIGFSHTLTASKQCCQPPTSSERGWGTLLSASITTDMHNDNVHLESCKNNMEWSGVEFFLSCIYTQTCL